MYYRKILFLLLLSILISFIADAEEMEGGKYEVSYARIVTFEPGTSSGERYSVEVKEQVPEFNLPGVAEGRSTVVIPVGEIPPAPPEEVEEEVPLKEGEEKVVIAREKEVPPEEVPLEEKEKIELAKEEVLPEEVREEVREEELVEVIPEEYEEEVGIEEKERVEEIGRKVTLPEIGVVEKKKEEIKREEEKRLEEQKKLEELKVRKAVPKKYGKVFIVICLIIILLIFLKVIRKE